MIEDRITTPKLLLILLLFIILIVSLFYLIFIIGAMLGVYPTGSKLPVALQRVGPVGTVLVLEHYYAIFSILLIGSIVGIVLLVKSFSSPNKER